MRINGNSETPKVLAGLVIAASSLPLSLWLAVAASWSYVFTRDGVHPNFKSAGAPTWFFLATWSLVFLGMLWLGLRVTQRFGGGRVWWVTLAFSAGYLLCFISVAEIDPGGIGAWLLD